MYKIKPFTAGFLPQVMQIELNRFKSDMFPQSVFNDLLNSPCVIGMVALTKANKVAAYIMLRHTGIEAEILTIAVDTPFLKQGIGSMLMEKSIINLASGGVKELFLEVRPTNTPAIELYKKFGAEYIATRSNYYENEDADVYMLKIA